MTGQRLVSDLIRRRVVLTGAPGKAAMLRQADNAVWGERIILDREGDSASVVGPGRLRFVTDADLSGNRTDTPRPVDVAWTKGLDYHVSRRVEVVAGKRRAVVEPVALIRGDVRLTTGGDELRAGNLRVIFEKEPDRPASRPATAPSAPTDLGTFRPKKIAHVLAGEQVRLASVTRDAEGYLLRRLTLASPSGQVAYDVAARRLRCLGPGQFVAEDYRPPSPAAGGEQAGALPGGGITRPWNAAWRFWTVLRRRNWPGTPKLSPLFRS